MDLNRLLPERRFGWGGRGPIWTVRRALSLRLARNWVRHVSRNRRMVGSMMSVSSLGSTSTFRSQNLSKIGTFLLEA